MRCVVVLVVRQWDRPRIGQWSWSDCWCGSATGSGGDLQGNVAERLGGADGVLIIKDTDYLKKGTISAEAQRQYFGTVGRTGNGQIGVLAA